jgi:hypothetical protein
MIDLLRTAADHAIAALPHHLATLVHQQLTATADVIEGPASPWFGADDENVTKAQALAREVLRIPALPVTGGDRVQAAARAMWALEFPPDTRMTWDEMTAHDPTCTDRYVQLAAAALAAAAHLRHQATETTLEVARDAR